MTNVAETAKFGVVKESDEGPRLGAFRLEPWFSPRPWGKESLAPWYAGTGTTEKVGEAWLTGPKSTVATGPRKGQTLEAVVTADAETVLGSSAGRGVGEREFPLLVKMLFPAEKLSVQVHPDDAEAQKRGQPRGKTECWYVLEAEPGAVVALGLKDGVDAAAVRQAIGDGTLEELMRMVPVTKGDMVFVDAGTVHAIFPGVVLLETQQTSDTTFRMFDYGRPRELHVEEGLAVTKFVTNAGKVPPQQRDGFVRLIEQQYFSVDLFEGSAELTMDGPGCLVGLASGIAVLTNGGSVELPAGEAVVIPSGATVVVEAPAGAAYLRCVAP